MSSPTLAFAEPPISTVVLPASATAARLIDGLFAVRVEPAQHRSAIDSGRLLPYDGLMLTVCLPHPSSSSLPADDNQRNGRNWIWPLHTRTGRWRTCAQDCVTLMAVLKAPTALALMRQLRLGEWPAAMASTAPSGRLPLSALVGSRASEALDTAIDAAPDVADKLTALARWVEDETVGWLHLDITLQRLSEALLALREHSSASIADVAARAGINRRWFERECARWLDASPKQLQLAARFQQVMRLRWRGMPAAQIAATLGLADQAHLSRSVRQASGLTMTALRGTDVAPVSRAFRVATGGAHVFA
jgi:AraC-like DNA-binding protein